MNITRNLFLASVLVPLIATPAGAQSQKQGDYYTPTQTTARELTPGQLQQTEEGDYYVADHMVLRHHRVAALTACTDGIKFASDRYIRCMLKEGESP